MVDLDSNDMPGAVVRREAQAIETVVGDGRSGAICEAFWVREVAGELNDEVVGDWLVVFGQNPELSIAAECFMELLKVVDCVFVVGFCSIDFVGVIVYEIVVGRHCFRGCVVGRVVEEVLGDWRGMYFDELAGVVACCRFLDCVAFDLPLVVD
ncbi:hypothetical protein DRW03_34865 [Corallococcus sp. H22C18031201]|nr:hypothetical protein DRW03_34865 [Corallococcus sp. H22C18031201]